ncbi:DUF488 domain-containing protein [Rarobacter incanus]|nr:DUF488 family protein [Rarobacter incanus]
MLRIKRVYEAAVPADGFRVLVDRLWPRGVTKARAAVDLWAKSVAPSTELRRWWGHDPATFPEFARRYRAELDGDDLTAIRAAMRDHDQVTLLYAAHDPAVNHAVVLRDYLTQADSDSPDSA